MGYIKNVLSKRSTRLFFSVNYCTLVFLLSQETALGLCNKDLQFKTINVSYCSGFPVASQLSAGLAQLAFVYLLPAALGQKDFFCVGWGRDQNDCFMTVVWSLQCRFESGPVNLQENTENQDWVSILLFLLYQEEMRHAFYQLNIFS